MRTPIIFLDLDGVLNHEHHFVNYDKNQPHSWHLRYFHQPTVKILNRITDATKARIVFSSSHRVSFDTLKELQDGLFKAGVTGKVIGKTPKLKFENNSYSVPRGCEIKAWIEENKNILGDKVSKFKYAILDDDTDMLYWQRNSFFCTAGYHGLTDEIADRVIEHLL